MNEREKRIREAELEEAEPRCSRRYKEERK
jgi:hypothetical protein